ncbi:MAG: D-alanyl-D-alanine carboxypeptidase [Deltaproteobacteria bacterium]|nr:D-alanyl-D-alanine carboxypeptidase [Deltaproteobacteria bacterium]
MQPRQAGRPRRWDRNSCRSLARCGGTVPQSARTPSKSCVQPEASHHRNRPERPRNPASNQKLLTSAAALRRLGPTFRARTKVEGKIDNGRVNRLVVRASGDPSLGYARLAALAEAVHLRGVDTVDRILIDARGRASARRGYRRSNLDRRQLLRRADSPACVRAAA